MFRRVEAEQAGPTALGILVPPSRRTVLIVRPRGLPWDLVLTQPGGGFREMNREEAEHIAHQVADLLESNAVCKIEPVYSLDEGSVWLRVSLGPYALTVCTRAPGQPYKAHFFVNAASAHHTGDELRALLQPAQAHEQEIYINTHSFTRSR